MGTGNLLDLSSQPEFKVSVKQVSYVMMASVINCQKVNYILHAIQTILVHIAQNIILSDTQRNTK